MDTQDVTPTTKPDGRLQRSERSRQAIVVAMLELVEEGNLVPTAQQVAERGGVGIRSVFRHFEDMESIFASTSEFVMQRVQGLFSGGNREGVLAERIVHATQQHFNAFESLQQIILSGQVRRWQSATLRKTYAGNQQRLRRNLDSWLPELAALPSTRREAAEAIVSFENWQRLRQHQKLSRNSTVQIAADMLALLSSQDISPAKT
ncbi:MAG: TetR/AcrR family transcriptional regulator [Halioglobus sp.]